MCPSGNSGIEIADVCKANPRNIAIPVVRPLSVWCVSSCKLSYVSKQFPTPSVLMVASLPVNSDWRMCAYTEHVEEDGSGERVELGDGGAALGAQCIRLVQDLPDLALLWETRIGKRQCANHIRVEIRHRHAFRMVL